MASGDAENNRLTKTATFPSTPLQPNILKSHLLPFFRLRAVLVIKRRRVEEEKPVGKAKRRERYKDRCSHNGEIVRQHGEGYKADCVVEMVAMTSRIESEGERERECVCVAWGVQKLYTVDGDITALDKPEQRRYTYSSWIPQLTCLLGY
ncbi:hypothetical protein BHM03_00052651 [Ensete ventricosum]|nr:hypothetical protein BHM03_00052651 [Ensete ventricosum]